MIEFSAKIGFACRACTTDQNRGVAYLIVQLRPESTAHIASSAFAVTQNKSSQLLPALSHLTRLRDLASGMVVAKINNPRRKCAQAAGFRSLGRGRSLVGGRVRGRRSPAASLDFDLATQFLHDALQLLQPLDQLNLAQARRFRRGIRILGPVLARRAAGRGECTGNQGAPTIGAGHLLVASHLAPPAGDAGSRIQQRCSRVTRGQDGAKVGVWPGRLVDGDIIRMMRRCGALFGHGVLRRRRRGAEVEIYRHFPVSDSPPGVVSRVSTTSRLAPEEAQKRLSNMSQGSVKSQRSRRSAHPRGACEGGGLESHQCCGQLGRCNGRRRLIKTALRSSIEVEGRENGESSSSGRRWGETPKSPVKVSSHS